MAFGAMVPSASVVAFNAPGFKDNPGNNGFFDALSAGAKVPANGSGSPRAINVVADQVGVGSVEWQAIAMLHSRPGEWFDAAIENQWLSGEPEEPTGTWNHSQMVLTDALAVHALLERLQPGLSTSGMSTLLSQASNQEYAGLERIVDGLQALLGIDTAPMAVGHSNRESMYLGIKGITDHPGFEALAGQLRFSPAFDTSAARTDFAALLSLTLGLPFQASTNDTGATSALAGVHGSAYVLWEDDRTRLQSGADSLSLNFTDEYLRDRAAYLSARASYNATDGSNNELATGGISQGYRTQYVDLATGNSLLVGSPILPVQQVRFGGDGNDATGLIGGLRDDRLYGGAGSDTMIGGPGDDTYVVNVSTDVVTEAAGEGIDTVRSSVTLTLGANVESLTLTGTSNRNGTGNSLDNVLVGNTGVNVLTGNAGNDVLDGGAGNDTLIGSTGADDYLFGRGWGVDTIQENDSTANVTDRVLFGAGIVQADTSYVRSGNNLEVRINGSADKLVVKDWYLGSKYQVEQFRYVDGSMVTNSQVAGLIGAMAGFAPGAAAASASLVRPLPIQGGESGAWLM